MLGMLGMLGMLLMLLMLGDVPFIMLIRSSCVGEEDDWQAAKVTLTLCPLVRFLTYLQVRIASRPESLASRSVAWWHR